MVILCDCARLATGRSTRRSEMVMQKAYISKTSDTSADTLLAVGFASYLADIYRERYQTTDDIFISDVGSCYGTELPQPLGNIETLNLSGITLIQPFNSGRQREKLVQKGMSSEMIAGF